MSPDSAEARPACVFSTKREIDGARPNQAVVLVFGKAHRNYVCLRIQNDTTVDYCEATSLRIRDTLNVRNGFAFDPDASKRAARRASRGGMGVASAELQTDLHAARGCAP